MAARYRPTPTQARKEGFSGRLFERMSSVGLIGLWKVIGEIQRAVDGRSLLLLLDEGEAFSKMVSVDAQASMGSGLRTLFDPDNRSLGIALGLNTPTSRLARSLHWLALADAAQRPVEAHVPLVTWQLLALHQLLSERGKLAKWLEQQQREATSFLVGVYEARNQLVHDANPFGFDDTYRLGDLYKRYRVVINPVVAEVLRLVGADFAMPLNHAWAQLRARFKELLAHQGTGKKSDAVDIQTVLGCLDH